MSANSGLRILSVRVPEPQLRQLKSDAAARGLSLQAAVREAVEAWMTESADAENQDLETAFSRLRGTLAGTDVWARRRRDKAGEWGNECEPGRRRSHTASA